MLPAGPRIDEILQKERVAADVATTQRSGGPNFLLVATDWVQSRCFVFQFGSISDHSSKPAIC